MTIDTVSDIVDYQNQTRRRSRDSTNTEPIHRCFSTQRIVLFWATRSTVIWWVNPLYESLSERFEKGSDGILFKQGYLRCNMAAKKPFICVLPNRGAGICHIQIDFSFAEVHSWRVQIRDVWQGMSDLQPVWQDAVWQSGLSGFTQFGRHRGCCVAVPKVGHGLADWQWCRTRWS